MIKLVCIRESGLCRDGKHKECSGGQSTKKGTYGGWMCSCGCHSNPNFFDKPKEGTVRIVSSKKELGKILQNLGKPRT